MYNSIYPVNINYTKNQYRKSDKNSSAQNATQNQAQGQNSNTFPNGTKVAIDYSKGQINISQVLTDFRSTIIAINAPEDVKDEVSMYLNLVDKESKKENPSKEIIVANLKNASKISDAFIASSLKKPSNVVEGWIDALFLQKINLKADPNEVNPDFLLEFPKNAKQKIAAQKETTQEQPQEQVTEAKEEIQNQGQIQTQRLAQAQEFQNAQAPKETQTQIQGQIQKQGQISGEVVFSNAKESGLSQEEIQNLEIENNLELSQKEIAQAPISSSQNAQSTTSSPFQSFSQIDEAAKEVLAQIKSLPKTNEGDTKALNLINEALGAISENQDETNRNIKAALHFERAKIFDGYDYVDYALRDYWEATKADELNLKAQAYFKSGMIYDEFNEFDPALDGYLSSVAYSGEADNIKAQTLVLSKIASLYAKQFDIDKTQEYSSLAQESATQTNNYRLIAKTYSTSAQNEQYLGENDKAIDSYKNALFAYSKEDESYMDMALNYEQAANVMRKLGNSAKADKLQAKAQIYYQKAQLEDKKLAKAS